MHRRLKQLAYLIIFLAFWALVALAAYALFFKPVPSCVDHRQNQGEEGVDCGGPCRQFCIPATLHAIQVVGEPRVFQPSADRISLVVKLQNPNTEFAAQSFGYVATLYGDTGASATITGTSFMYAGDIKYVALLAPPAAIGRPVRATFTVGSPAWVPLRLFTKPSLRIQNQTTTVAVDGSVRVDGTLASDDTRTLREVSIVALFYGGRGELLGASQTVLDSLSAGATSPFVIAYPPLSGVLPESTQVFVSAIRP